jgi:hypothetical protein
MPDIFICVWCCCGWGDEEKEKKRGTEGFGGAGDRVLVFFSGNNNFSR